MSTFVSSHRISRRLTWSTAICTAFVLGVAACGTTPSTPTPASSPATSTSGTSGGGTGATGDSAVTGSVRQLWAQAWKPASEGRPAAGEDVAVSHDGTVAYVVGHGPVIAYKAASGAQRWAATSTGWTDGAAAVTVSADGATVFATGTASAAATGEDYLTVAFDAATGKPLWRTTYAGKGAGADNPAAIVTAGSLVVVNGTSAGSPGGTDFATVAYDATTGAERWVGRYDERATTDQGWFPSGAHSLVASADGTTVYAAGATAASGGESQFATIAYDASTGARRWVTTYGASIAGNDSALAVGVSPDGRTVVTTGFSEAKATKTDSATVAYDAATGKQLWVARYDGPAHQNEGTGSIGFSSDGATLFVAGTSEGATQGHGDMITLAYATPDGSKRWAARWNGPAGGDDNASDLAVSPDGTTVVVTGRTVPAAMQDQYATIGQDSATGAVRWTATYAAPATAEPPMSEAHAVAITSSGTVIVTGVSGPGFATVAYRPGS
jgi:outer membrane protein assembly factor BamB